MTEEIEQQIVELLRAESLTNEGVDRLNDAVWRLSFVKPVRAKELGVQALGLSIKNDYRRGSGYALKNIGWCELHLDDCRQAETMLDRSRKIFADLRDKRGTAAVLNALATARRKTGDFQMAIEYHSSALELYEETNDKAGAAGALLNVGIVHNQTGNYALALDYYYQSLALAAEARAPIIKARTHACLGDALRRVKETDLAIENSRQAIEIFQENPDRRNVCVALVNLGAAYQQRQNFAEAAGFYQQGLEKAREVGNVETQAEAHKCLGGVCLEFSESAAAIAHFEQALKLARQIENRYFESETLLQFGLAQRKLGNRALSVEFLEQALSLSEELNADEINYQAHLALSEIYQERRQAQTALIHFQSFHRIWSKLYNAASWSRIQRILFQQESGEQSTSGAAVRLNQQSSAPFDAQERNSLLSPRKLEQVIKFINHHLEHNLTVAKLAEIVGLSQNYFLLLFKQATGKTPHQFLLERRIAHARKLLRATDLPLAEIALRCGFNSQSHFSTHFRLVTGFTPGQYRRSS